jgi:alginate O-acetyltransferase complex protein AlgI
MWGEISDRRGVAKTLAYFFATPSMDARGVFAAVRGAKPQAASPAAAAAAAAAGEWWYAMRNIVAGAGMVWIVARTLAAAHPMLATWIGMIGAVLMLHFGAFHLLALASGTQPLMNRPTRAATLGEFWGRRWNRGFSTPARKLVFAPLIRRGYSVTTATAAVYVVSGLVHDLVISVPAGGGYGLPTLYFLLQLAGVLVERTTGGRRLARRHPVVGRAVALAFALLPAPLLLFPGPFVRNVFAPFLHAIGGLP